MQANATEHKPGEPVAWWFKFLTRAVGVIGGIVAMVTGVMVCMTIHPICLVAGIMQICAGFVLIVFEAPCCCPFLDFIDKIGKFSETRPFWHKAIMYCVMSIFPIAMCFSISSVLGSGLIFADGVLYGLMFLGRKADRQQMRLNAMSDMEMKTTLMDNEEQVSLHVPDGQEK
ncbi:hypothetical protein ScPMuIL_011150 [Solemya velum]